MMMTMKFFGDSGGDAIVVVSMCFRPVSAINVVYVPLSGVYVYLSVRLSGRIVAELAVAKQCGRNLLHPHHRSRPLYDRRFHRVFRQVADGRPATAGTPNTPVFP